MMYTRFLLLLILAFLLCPGHARAQQKTSRAANAALREKAFNLLESAAGQLSTLQSPENRARLGANIADSLWSHDDKRARSLFALVQDDIIAGLANRDLDDPADAHTIKVFLKLRVDTVQRIAKYDGEFALAFLKSTEFVSDKPLPAHLIESEQGLETRLARQMANNNPARAVKLARQSLAQGFSEDLTPLLREVSKKDKEQALILYKEIISKLRDVNLDQDWQARNFAENLVQTVKPPTSDNSLFRELIGIFITRALEHGCANSISAEDPKANFCQWAVAIIPHIERIDPRAAQLRRWMNQERQQLNISPEAIQSWYEIEDGTVEDVLAFAGRYPELAQDVYWEAIRRAGAAGDLELARKIATQHVTDSGRKEMILTELDRRLKSSSADEKKLAEIESGLKELKRPIERVQHLLSYADDHGSYDRNTSLKLIKQATDIVDMMKPGKEQVEAQIAVALAYCLLKNDRGFAIMESLMPKLNELVDASVKLDGYETRYVRDGEWNMSANGNIGVMLTNLSESAGKFAWADFDRAVSLSAQFDRTEIRLMAQVKLAQAVLSEPPRPMMELRFLYH